MTVVIMYNCRFLFISIQKRTSLYYQSCHSLKNREKGPHVVEQTTLIFLLPLLMASADTENRTPRKKV